jgi:hypothetical protein
MEYVMKKRPYICTAKLRNIQMIVAYWILYLLYYAVLIFYASASKWNCGIVPSLWEVGSRGGFPNRLGSDSTWRTAFEEFAMSAPVMLGSGFDGALPRKLARKSREFRPAGSRSRREPRIFSTR